MNAQTWLEIAEIKISELSEGLTRISNSLNEFDHIDGMPTHKMKILNSRMSDDSITLFNSLKIQAKYSK